MNRNVTRLSSIAVAGCLLGLLAPPAIAKVSTRERLAEAIAATHVCKNVSLNRKAFESAAKRAGLDTRKGSGDLKTLEREARAKAARLYKFDPRIVCLLGETNFGPEGVIIRNLLKVHKRTPPMTQF